MSEPVREVEGRLGGRAAGVAASPTPNFFAIDVVPAGDRHLVRVTVTHPVGSSVFFAEARIAQELGRLLIEAGSRAEQALLVATRPLPGHR